MRPRRGDKLIWYEDWPDTRGAVRWEIVGSRMYKDTSNDDLGYKYKMRAIPSFLGGESSYCYFISKDLEDDPRWQYEDEFLSFVRRCQTEAAEAE